MLVVLGLNSRFWLAVVYLVAWGSCSSSPYRLEFEDGFADENGEPVADMDSAHEVVTLEQSEGRTRMTIVPAFANVEQLEQWAAMGVEGGMRETMGQIDALLVEDVGA